MSKIHECGKKKGPNLVLWGEKGTSWRRRNRQEQEKKGGMSKREREQEEEGVKEKKNVLMDKEEKEKFVMKSVESRTILKREKEDKEERWGRKRGMGDEEV